MLETEGVKEDDNDDINILEELEDSSQRHSSVGEKLTDDCEELVTPEALDSEDRDVLETKEILDSEDSDELETKEEEDVDGVRELLEELDSFELLLFKLWEEVDDDDDKDGVIDELLDVVLLLLGDSVDENMLEELEDSSQRHSSVTSKLTDECEEIETKEVLDSEDRDGLEVEEVLDSEDRGGLEAEEVLDSEDTDGLETNEEEDVDEVCELWEEVVDDDDDDGVTDELLDVMLLMLLEDDMMRLELLLVSEDVKEDESGDINALEELEDSSQRHSSVGEKLTDECEELVTPEALDSEDGNELETKEEEDCDDVCELLEELESFELLLSKLLWEEVEDDDEAVADELLDIMLLLLLRDDKMELELLLVSEDVSGDESVDENALPLEELEDSSQRHSSVGEKLTDERDDVESDDCGELVIIKVLDFEDSDEQEIKEEEDVYDVCELLEELNSLELLLCKLLWEEQGYDDIDDVIDELLLIMLLLLLGYETIELELMLVSEDVEEDEDVNENTLEELEDSSQRQSSSNASKLADDGKDELSDCSEEEDMSKLT